MEMIESYIRLLGIYFESFILYYTIFICSSYLFIAIVSTREILNYMRKNRGVDYRRILSSQFAPSLSIICPLHNEENTIIETIRSLLSLHYTNYEIIIVNDGSTDKSLQKLIECYELEPVQYIVNYKLECKKIKGIYRSKNSVYKKLVVVDKDNGKKSDAINAGLNIANNEYIITIDADCIFEQDALIKMVKPILEDSSGEVISAGGVIRVANSCIVKDGKLVEVKLPDNFFAGSQVLEYIRAFMLGRMGWTKFDGMLLVSGAFGLFNKELLINCGGFSKKTIGEDMEVGVRMRMYMRKRKKKYKVLYIPDPLCWTETPGDVKILGTQRNRWARGTIETLWTHKKLFLNPRYGKLGLISYPYWFFFELLAPIIEFCGYMLFIFMLMVGAVNWEFLIPLVTAIYIFTVTYSMFAILIEEITYSKYTKKREITRLVLLALLEPISLHLVKVWWTVEGCIYIMLGKGGWGKMTRTGFAAQK